MKKIFFAVLVIVSFLALNACSGSSQLKSLTIYVDDGSISPQYYSETTVTLVPDYEARTLEVSYSEIYPTRTEETEEQDFETSGTVGDEYFDRFEIVVDLLDRSEELEITDEDIAGSGNFKVTAVDLNGKEAEISTYWVVESDEIETMKTYYLDLTTLLVGDVQI